MTDQPDLDKSAVEIIEAAVKAALADGQENHPANGLVVSWALSVEVMGSDGQLWLHRFNSPDAVLWRTLGMLDAHCARIRAALSDSGDDQ